MKRLLRGTWTVLRRRGVSYFGYLLTGMLIPKIAYLVLYRLPRRHLRKMMWLVGVGIVSLTLVTLSLLLDTLTAILILLTLGIVVLVAWVGAHRREMTHMQREARRLTERAQLSCRDDTFTSWKLLPVETHTRKAVESARKANFDEEIVIGRIDQDGRVLGLFGELPGLEAIDENGFSERIKYGLDIVLIKDNVLVRKDFHGDKAGFMREWYSLVILFGKANVPAIYQVDEDHCKLYVNLIPGPTVRDILVYAGARIRDVQTKDDPELAGLDPVLRAEIITARGTALIPSCFSEEFLREVERQLDKVHACGVAGLDVKFGNVVVDPASGSPWFVDFERARAHRSPSSLVFAFKRDRDRVKLNQTYGRNLMTETSARAALAAQVAEEPHWYAPIDFGNGLTIGLFWSVNFGTGRWEFLKHVLAPLVTGKRVLDLGSNNGVMPIMMLRAGAREVIGVELSPVEVERAQLVHRIYEWRDMRRYALCIHNCDMLDILQKDWGKFDAVTAFCSLYYLQADDMARVVRKAFEMSPIMVIQANTETGQKAAKRERASVTFLKKLLQDNGFPNVETFAPPNYSRPLLVGRASSG